MKTIKEISLEYKCRYCNKRYDKKIKELPTFEDIDQNRFNSQYLEKWWATYSIGHLVALHQCDDNVGMGGAADLLR